MTADVKVQMSFCSWGPSCPGDLNIVRIAPALAAKHLVGAFGFQDVFKRLRSSGILYPCP